VKILPQMYLLRRNSEVNLENHPDLQSGTSESVESSQRKSALSKYSCYYYCSTVAQKLHSFIFVITLSNMFILE